MLSSALRENRVLSLCALCLPLYLCTWRPISSPAASCIHRLGQYLAMLETTSISFPPTSRWRHFSCVPSVCLSILFIAVLRYSMLVKMSCWHRKVCFAFAFLGTLTAEVGEPVQTTRCMHVRPRFRYDEHVRDLKPPISNRAGRQADLTSSRPRNHFGFLSFIQRAEEAS